ncbi:hypothetical protein [Streptomyces sp. NBC_00019]|uniref:hypothetical protein n=1 Tax=Streptomyces sp. NBC_00019 TaxID=2975623 RepID=UPI00324C4D96
MLVGEVVRIAPDGVRVTTPDVDDERAVIEVATRVENDSIAVRTADVVTEIRDADGNIVATDVSNVTVLPGEPATVRQRLYVRTPFCASTPSTACGSMARRSSCAAHASTTTTEFWARRPSRVPRNAGSNSWAPTRR